MVLNMTFDFKQVGSEFAQGFFSGIKQGGSDILESFEKNEPVSRFFKAVGIGVSEAFDTTNASFSWSIIKRTVPTVGIFMAVTTGVPHAVRYFFELLIANIGKPKMAIKQRKTTIFTPLKNLFSKPTINTRKAFFNEKISEQIEEIAASTKNISENGASFQNVILYGPPGTGKTMIAEAIAEKSDLDYVTMSSGNLTQFIKRKEHVSELNRLFDSAENGKKPTLIFIDEAEGLAKNRDDLDQEHVELLNTFLARTGSPSKKIMLVLATNRLKDIDQAVLNRMTHNIEINAPEFEQRVAIINQYANELFTNSPNLSRFFNQEAIQKMAQKTEGLSGRNLFYIVNAIYSLESITKNRELTQEKIDTVVDRFSPQQKKTEEPDKEKQPQKAKACNGWFG